MRRVRGEALQFGKRSFKSREGVVEHGGEPAKLIIGIRIRQTFRKRFRT